MEWSSALRRGLVRGAKTSWDLLRIIVPVYIGVAVLVASPVMDWLAVVFRPAMRLFGLPPEAAIPITLGLVSGLYAAVGAVASLGLTPKEMLVIAVMLSFAHNLFVESAVTQRLGIPLRLVAGLRLGLAVAGGLAVHWLL